MLNLRLLFGTLLILALALPLSTCSVQTEDNSQTVQHDRYLLSDNSHLQAWALGFLLPAALAFALRKRRPSLVGEALCVLSVVPAGLVIWWHAGTGTLTIGGYLALLAILLYLLVTLLMMFRIIRGAQIATSAPEG
jgi:hypothetical protein